MESKTTRDIIEFLLMYNKKKKIDLTQQWIYLDSLISQLEEWNNAKEYNLQEVIKKLEEVKNENR